MFRVFNSIYFNNLYILLTSLMHSIVFIRVLFIYVQCYLLFHFYKHIYIHRRLSTTINGMPGRFMDGGVWAFTPPIFNIKVSPFPAEYVRLLFPKAVPDIALPNGRYPINKLMHWALFPPKDPMKLKILHDEGFESANRWIEKNIEK